MHSQNQGSNLFLDKFTNDKPTIYDLNSPSFLQLQIQNCTMKQKLTILAVTWQITSKMLWLWNTTTAYFMYKIKPKFLHWHLPLHSLKCAFTLPLHTWIMKSFSSFTSQTHRTISKSLSSTSSSGLVVTSTSWLQSSSLQGKLSIDDSLRVSSSVQEVFI